MKGVTVSYLAERIQLFDRVTDVDRRVEFVRAQIAQLEQSLETQANGNPERLAYDQVLLQGMHDTLKEVLREQREIHADTQQPPAAGMPAQSVSQRVQQGPESPPARR